MTNKQEVTYYARCHALYSKVILHEVMTFYNRKWYFFFSLPCIINGRFSTGIQSSGISSINRQQFCLQNLTCFSCYVKRRVSFLLMFKNKSVQTLVKTETLNKATLTSVYSNTLTGWKKLACDPNDKSLRQVSRFPVRTLEWSC